MEDRGLKISRNTTVYQSFNGDGNLDGNSELSTFEECKFIQTGHGNPRMSFALEVIVLIKIA